MLPAGWTGLPCTQTVKRHLRVAFLFVQKVTKCGQSVEIAAVIAMLNQPDLAGTGMALRDSSSTHVVALGAFLHVRFRRTSAIRMVSVFFTNVTQITAKNGWRPRVCWVGTLLALLAVNHKQHNREKEMILRPLATTLAVLCLSLCGNAQATVLEFDSGINSPFTYNFDYTATPYSYDSLNNGYNKMADATGYTNIGYIYSTSGQLSSTTAFDLTSMYIGGAWGNQSVIIEGLFGGSVQVSQGLDLTTNPTLFMPQWTGLDGVKITKVAGTFVSTTLCTGCQQIAVGSFTVNENSVPVPATLALFGLGLAGLGWSRRKKA